MLHVCNGAKGKSMRTKQREPLEFRTPQHPSLGTNNWGGESPLLARNIPKESLDQKYTKLNTVRTRDEIFPADHDHYYNLNHSSDSAVSKLGHGARRSCNRGRGILFKLLFPRKEKIREATLGSNSKMIRIRLPRLDPKNRWPQGWC